VVELGEGVKSRKMGKTKPYMGYFSSINAIRRATKKKRARDRKTERCCAYGFTSNQLVLKLVLCQKYQPRINLIFRLPGVGSRKRIKVIKNPSLPQRLHSGHFSNLRIKLGSEGLFWFSGSLRDLKMPHCSTPSTL